jgi:oxygen-dependent protoporphyrinogen oxidase
VSEGRVVTPQRRPHVVVVGGGISGLAAAWSLARQRHDLDITVLEASDAVGGKLRVGELEGMAVDEGAEAMLSVRPEGTRLVREAGLGDDLVTPADAAPRLLIGDELKPLPSGLVMGVPTDLAALARSGVLSQQALARLPLDHVMPGRNLGDDVSFGDFVGRRLGVEVVDRLVSPLLLGVYADRAVNVSMRAAAPRLFEAARHDRSLLAAALKVRGPESGDRASVFAGVRGGVGRLPLALADRLRSAGVAVETGASVRRLRRATQGWDVVVDAGGESRVVDADAVVLALPAPAAYRLLKGHSVQAEAELSEMRTTSVAVVTLVYRAADLPGGDLPDGSGYLVPPSAGRPVKAATFSSHKWQWVRDAADERGLVVARCSLGHADDTEVLERDDDELARVAYDDLAFVTRLGRARPVATRVTRWVDGLPRYSVGHVDRAQLVVSAVESLPGITVCGAAYDGVGIPACIARAEAAATHISRGLAHDGQWRHG